MSKFRASQAADLARRRRAVQRRIDRLEPRIRRRLRGKVRQFRHAFDLDDVLASARRRIDKALVRGNLELRTGNELAGYVWRTAQRVALEFARREGRHRRRLRRAVERGFFRLDPQHLTDRTLSSDETTQLVADVFGSLTDIERTMIIRWACGDAYRDIARELGLPLPAFRSRFQRLMGRLKRA